MVHVSTFWFFIVLKEIFGQVTGPQSCLEWVSSLDWQYRHMCFWFEGAPSYVTVFQADKYCRDKGGHGLAPYIDRQQYRLIESLRQPNTRRGIYIGVTDIGEENTWTHLDGTSIPLNDFFATLDTFLSNQPNGGRNQNCAIINEDDESHPNRTQDKECHSTSLTSDMICYRNMLELTNCHSWSSPNDAVFREHCYWVSTKRPGSASHKVADAMQNCLNGGGSIAPLIDTLQKSFLENTVMAVYLSKEPTASIWIGTHGSGGTKENWNGDPFYLLSGMSNPSGEKCLAYSAGGNYVWHNCDSNNNAVSVLCYKAAKLYTLPSTATTGSDMTSTDATLCPVVPTSGNAGLGTGTVKPVSAEEIKMDLTINPKDTNAYKLSKISVYEDRPSAIAIGGVGVGILVGVLVFIVFLDCQKIDKIFSKSQT